MRSPEQQEVYLNHGRFGETADGRPLHTGQPWLRSIVLWLIGLFVAQGVWFPLRFWLDAFRKSSSVAQA